MAKKLYEESNIQAIADAIRSKNGTTDTYTTAEMAAAITAITTSGGDGGECKELHLPEEALTLSSNCDYRFNNKGWDWLVKNFGDKITTKNISSAMYMFNQSELESIPFDFNFLTSTSTDASYMFYQAKVKNIGGKFIDFYPSKMANMFRRCYNLRYLPEFQTPNFQYLQSYKSANMSYLMANCYSLRSIPESLLKQLYNNAATSSSYYVFTQGFVECFSLDEIIGLNPQTVPMSSNLFSNTFNNCSRLKNIIFAMQEDGTPYVASWRNQVIDLTVDVGYASSSNKKYITNYNSGITEDKEVIDDATYQALKNDPDWFTTDIAYSRYNHDSAVATINSLPDTSACLAANGGTNTIKFKGDSGSATDGGAINTLTEEEIAVATAKGWTVQIV